MKISVSFGRLYSFINQNETKENLNEAKQTEESKSLLIFLWGGETKLKIVDIDLPREYMLAK